MKDDGFRFEEADDERTWGDGLVPDCEKVEASKQVEPSLPVLEYSGEFKALIDACGQVSYFYNMKRFVSRRAGNFRTTIMTL